tara:strand:- start:253 stop:1779 length:1527 start_codon:yes stop_codon:yes gene_type:complete
MAKFLNKKEQVFDIKLTGYGNYLLSIGKFKPAYYEFFDDNIIYDKRYAMYTGSIDPSPEKSNVNLMLRENQNEVHKRIKEETVYLESLVLFEELENNIGKLDTYIDESDTEPGAYSSDETPTMNSPRIDIYKSNQGIGDAFLVGAPHTAPAWKLVTLQGTITGSRIHNNINTISKIPQIDIDLKYSKKASFKSYSSLSLPPTFNQASNMNPENIEDMVNRTLTFTDGNSIEFITDHGLIYLDEVNTTLLTENFDIEVFDRTVTPPTHATASITLNTQPAEDDFIIVPTSYANFRAGEYYKYQFKNSDTSESGGTRYVTIGGDVSATAEALFNKIELSLAGELGGTAGKDQSFHNVTYDGDATISLTLNNAGQQYNFDLSDIGIDSASSIVSEATAGTFTIGGWSGGADILETLEKKYFKEETPQIVDGVMMHSNPQISYNQTFTTSSVEYYLDILTDTDILPEVACKGASVFNKESYYVDLDFDCDIIDDEPIEVRDIYGPVTEPEIC